ncbi:MAG TPA: ATP-binding protein [Pyrinomonadaceae bacterium]|nr:ATP-binding protein [Pyrinomonadaceae bacterium]
MQSRFKVFLTFALISVLPLLLISSLNHYLNRRAAKELVREDLAQQLNSAGKRFQRLLDERKQQLQAVATNAVLQGYLSQFHNEAVAASGRSAEARTPADSTKLKDLLAPLLEERQGFVLIAGFDPHQHPIFVAERPKNESELVVHNDNLLAYQIQPTAGDGEEKGRPPFCSFQSSASLGSTIRCVAGVASENNSSARLIGIIRFEPLIAESEAEPVDANSHHATAATVVLSDAGELVYHSNPALKHQAVATAMPYFATPAREMIAMKWGHSFFDQPNGDQWLISYQQLRPFNLSMGLARDYSAVSQGANTVAWIESALALLLGLAVALVLTSYYLGKTKSINRVVAGVDEIARGKLDHQFNLRSSDDLRPLADNVGIVTRKLREQLAREAEGRQFQSFVRLSAILTHDLKNAIEALSLIVGNMEQHYANKEFRADAMRSLTAATDNLRGLVTRLSNPVNTLSGEHKRPQPVDLIPILKRVIALIAEPARDKHEIKIKLPESLFALVDGDRIDKVIENLIINALEAMDNKPGTLMIEAAATEAGQPFFSVGDTGPGMSQRFIAERLFHPFATTKAKGVGLGLYTCREVVTANGGSINVQSAEDTGTTFTVVLPSPP